MALSDGQSFSIFGSLEPWWFRYMSPIQPGAVPV